MPHLEIYSFDLAVLAHRDLVGHEHVRLHVPLILQDVLNNTCKI
jgi:hypothetical protein